MPELPEVEVTRRRIAPKLEARRIAALVTTPASYFFLTPPDELKRRLVGRRLGPLKRHGKYLLLGIEDGATLLLHLGMTGQLFTASAWSVRLLSASVHRARRAPSPSSRSSPPDAPSPRASTGSSGGVLLPEAQAQFTPDAHTHLVLQFDDGGEAVLFRDVRKFGKVRWLAPGHTDPRLDKLGPDALEVSSTLLREAFRRRAAPVKSVLLDQSVLAGVGNIYADEALFRAGIRPNRPAQRLTSPQCERLAQALLYVLQRSIDTGGSSISDYVQPDGSDGSYQDERKVYARTDLPCLQCSAPIVRIRIGQRSTHYCRSCQR